MAHVLSKESTYVTGFCNIKCCEGTKPRSASGKPMKTCTLYPGCACQCHSNLTNMYESVGMERPLATTNPEYISYSRTYWMPEDADTLPDPIISNSDDTPEGDTLTKAPRAAGPPRVGALTEGTKAYGATPSGRKGRGQLEDEVRWVCNKFMKAELEGLCTPQLIAETIDADDPPALGGIHSVLNRWVEIGFAEIAVKPTRFTNYTVEGLTLGLETLKDRAKREKKRGIQQGRDAIRRGERL